MNYKIENYHSDGYVIIKNLLNKSLINDLKKIIKLNLYFRSKSKKKFFHDDLIRFRKRHTRSFSYFFDSLQTLSLNYNILTQKKIIKLANKLLKNSKKSISITDVALRIDPPFDDRNTLKWHQDSSYFRQNDNGFNGLVIWSPIFEINSKTGGIEFLEKSYKIGPQNVKRKKAKKGFSSQRSIDEDNLKKFKKIKCDSIKPGDAIIMNMDMIHRSSFNCSNKSRITLIGRYHNTISGDFNSGLNFFKYSDKKLNGEVHGHQKIL